jgi:NMD protein affecting ribosome stability and mRNA decay
MTKAKALTRSMDRRGSQSDKTPPVARRQSFSDPSICDRCGAVYRAKSWRRGRRLAPEFLDKARWVVCPGCIQVATGEYHGQVLIEVGDGTEREAISARVTNVADRAQTTQPERKIVSTNWNNKTLEVLTTSQKLAHRIAHEVQKAFGARVHYSWADTDGTLLATVKVKSIQKKPRKSK